MNLDFYSFFCISYDNNIFFRAGFTVTKTLIDAFETNKKTKLSLTLIDTFKTNKKN